MTFFPNMTSENQQQNAISRPHTPIESSSKGKQAVICVFCGASDGANPAHKEAAQSLGKALHAHKIRLVYGGQTISPS